MKKRVSYCDLLRLIAILSVIFIHAIADYRDMYFSLNNRIYYSLLTFADSFTRAGVPLFFMITGIFMLSDKKELSYKEFLFKRIPKLVTPFIIFSVIYYLYDLIILKSNQTSFVRFWNLLNSGGVIYHLWFMYSIITIYLFIPFLKKFIQKIKMPELKKLILIIFVFGNVITTINSIISRYHINFMGGFQLPAIIIYINYLFLGFYLFNVELNKKKRRAIYILGVLSVIIMPFADAIATTNVRNDAMLVATSCLSFLYTQALFVFTKYNYDKFKISEKAELLIGKVAPIVFYIYLVHVLVLMEARRIIYKYYFPNGLIRISIFVILLFILVTILSFIIAILIGKISKCQTNKSRAVTKI